MGGRFQATAGTVYSSTVALHQPVIARDAFEGAEEHVDELENLPTF